VQPLLRDCLLDFVCERRMHGCPFVRWLTDAGNDAAKWGVRASGGCPFLVVLWRS
jgi:hypothetical protein